MIRYQNDKYCSTHSNFTVDRHRNNDWCLFLEALNVKSVGFVLFAITVQ